MSRCRGATPDYHALLVLNMILGGQFVSRINMNLREDKGYTYGARTAFDFRRAPRSFRRCSASVQSDATADALREALGRDRAPSAASGRSRTRSWSSAAPSLTRGYPRNFETADRWRAAPRSSRSTSLPDDYFTTFVPKDAGADRGRRHARRGAPHRPRAARHGGRRRPRQAGALAGRRSISARRLSVSVSVKAVRFHEHGGSDVLRYEDAPDPVADGRAARWSASAPARSTISTSGNAAAWIASRCRCRTSRGATSPARSSTAGGTDRRLARASCCSRGFAARSAPPAASGRDNQCAAYDVLGLQSDGGYAELIVGAARKPDSASLITSISSRPRRFR